MDVTLYDKREVTDVITLRFLRLAWINWVSNECNCWCLYKRETEGDLTIEEEGQMIIKARG